MKRIIVVALFVIAAATRGAPAAGLGSVEGTVLDSETGQVVQASVSITIACGSLRKSASTDGSGHFLIASLPEGSCTLTTGGATYAASSVTVSVAGGSIATILVHVMSKAYLQKI